MSFFSSGFRAEAQERIFRDSLNVNGPTVFEQKLLFLQGLNLSGNDFFVNPTAFKMPDFLKQPLISNSGFSSDFKLFDSYSVAVGYPLVLYSPFVSSFRVLTQGHYKLSDRLTLGGNSFAGRSLFDPVKLNPSVNEMNIRGASMFLQYKVSDKVKIETRIQMNTGPGGMVP